MRVLVLILTAAAAAAWSPAVGGLMSEYRSAGATDPLAARGKAAWSKEYPNAEGGVRSCASCHGSDVRQAGKHATTGERIAPLSPQVQPDRLTEAAEIEKWFGRNCKWTMARSCTPQEKADFLAYLSL